MALTTDDRVTVTELISLHGQLVDDGETDRLDEVFAADATFDLSDFGFGIVAGLKALGEAGIAVGAANPVGHHVTNVVLTEVSEGRIAARSKGIGVRADGTVGSVVYEDAVERGPNGWRIVARRIAVRRTPLTRA